MRIPKRRGMRRAAFAVGGTIVVVVAGFVVWNRNFDRASAFDPGMSCPMTVEPTAHPPLAAIGMKRVALIGDSIMEQSSCAVADSLAQVGVETRRYAVFGSGLLSGFDWQSEIATILRTQHPNAVIAVFVGNYLPGSLLDTQGHVVIRGSPEFFSLWQQRAVSLSDAVRAAGAEMFWVSPPTAATPTFEYAQRLYEGYRTIPGDRTLDAGRALEDGAGREAVSKITCGTTQVLRTPDGHLTPDGARLYGQEIAHQFTAATGLITSPLPC